MVNYQLAFVKGSKLFKALATIIILLGLSAYFLWPSQRNGPDERVSVSELLANARNFDGKAVSVRGTVSGNFSVFQVGGFFLQDGNSRIPIITKSGAPKDGEIIELRGVFKQAFQFGNADQSVIFAR